MPKEIDGFCRICTFPTQEQADYSWFKFEGPFNAPLVHELTVLNQGHSDYASVKVGGPFETTVIEL